MTSVTIYHNPRCSKSRQTLALLEGQDIDINIVSYLTAPPSPEILQSIIDMLGVSAMDIIRTGEDEYKRSGLTKDSSDSAAIAAIGQAPKLLQRPIVVNGNKARIGRPPECVLEIL
jgi:arsenate reductase